jgi:hypothetical protein
MTKFSNQIIVSKKPHFFFLEKENHLYSSSHGCLITPLGVVDDDIEPLETVADSTWKAFRDGRGQ